MAAETIPLFSTRAYNGRSVNASAVRLVNMFSTQIDDRGSALGYPTPGLTLFTSLGASPARGMWVSKAFPSRLYVANNEKLFELDNAGTAVTRGTLNTFSGRVSMADNGIELIVVDGSQGWILNLSTNVFTQITDPEFPASRHVTFLDGYFIVSKTGTGEFALSGLLDGSSWSGIDFGTAESLPDPIVRPHAQGSYLLLYGESSLEVWANTGALGFPFSRISGATQDWGLAAGDSLVKVGDDAVSLGVNDRGERALIVAGPNGIRKVVPNPDVEHEWQQYPASPDASAIAYRREGQMFYQITFPGANQSWLYNLTGDTWSEVDYQGAGRHRSEISQLFLGRMIVSDHQNGNLYILDSSAYSDDGVFISRKIVTPHVYDQGFNRIKINRVRLDVEAGVGLANGFEGVDPYIGLRVSKDGGHSFGNQISRPFGKIGEFEKKPVWSRLGGGTDFAIQFEMTDPVPFRVNGATALVEVGVN